MKQRSKRGAGWGEWVGGRFWAVFLWFFLLGSGGGEVTKTSWPRSRAPGHRAPREVGFFGFALLDVRQLAEKLKILFGVKTRPKRSKKSGFYGVLAIVCNKFSLSTSAAS